MTIAILNGARTLVRIMQRTKVRAPFIASCLLAFCLLPSCNVISQKVTVVQDRNPDGTFKPTKDVLNSTGQPPVANGRIYLYLNGEVAVSGNLSFPSNSRPLNLRH